ncbi:type VII secretion integral membrane protein EccD [Mycobacterium sp. 1482292.6]|uniref:type VII secretion integral membrane protein EccD n=1 Tax=Mycobacterium sp. 1482292.6 TaxID=1834081 RepID=UPI0007FE95BA|nr:type VII secretion integral membrane protein EccD [Mycobacterium sp. 1482292.6]
MTGALATDVGVMSPAPQRVRLSFLSSRTQVDVSLPLDVPIVVLLPHLVKLTAPREVDASEDPSITEAKNDIWVLNRHDGETPLPPDSTLREAGVAEGELLRLTAKRALTPPTLYDDVVDAAARLNKAAHPGWDGTAARWMAFAGVYLTSGGWVYLLLSNTFAAKRTPLVAWSVTVALALVGAAALAYRRYAQRDIAAALGWAALPIAGAVTWVAVHGLGGYGLAAGCAAMTALCAVLHLAVGTGHWGYLVFQVICALGGIALALYAAGLGTSVAGVGLALVATLACLAVPSATRRFPRVAALRRRHGRSDVTSGNPSRGHDVWARVRSETFTRSALYAGLALSAGLGAVVVLISVRPVRWSGAIFALACAATLALHSQRPITVVERAALAAPAVALTVLSCLLAQNGSRPISIVTFGALLVMAVVFAVIGATARPGRAPQRLQALLAYLHYLVVAALIPLALWVVDGYERWGSA